MENNIYLNGEERKILRQLLRRNISLCDKLLQLHHDLFGFRRTLEFYGVLRRQKLLQKIYGKVEKKSKTGGN